MPLKTLPRLRDKAKSPKKIARKYVRNPDNAQEVQTYFGIVSDDTVSIDWTNNSLAKSGWVFTTQSEANQLAAKSMAARPQEHAGSSFIKVGSPACLD
ncbi:hypothetical protein [Rhodopseudomonas palustris]|uniref:hypothetical protein n=1 Tax=Rhodopseudomonas palustris TaxID=1076 RepID=UPI001058C60C|nr:hypothetical protein [Rhodopseudomonas palustris]QLH72437.1 hypothetical protein HZF03_17220 [Rhodopseudomonas palustris]